MKPSQLSNRIALICAAPAALFAVQAIAQDAADAAPKVVVIDGVEISGADSITDNIAKSPQHNTLETAIGAAGLGGTLAGEGPFTVFAPNDAAFALLPAGTIETLTKAENKPALTKVLTYHVVPGKITAQDLFAQLESQPNVELTTVNGEKLTISKEGEAVKIQGVNNPVYLSAVDLPQSNGVVHIVNGVLVPTL